MTGKTIDTGILEILASKICHDLISPIGAINNGVEFMEEDSGPEVISLITHSAAQASAKLQAYRMAYGAGGADSNHRPEDVYKNIELLVSADKKIRQEWDPKKPLGPMAQKKGFCKILICAILLAMESLPKGGTISVAPGKDGSVLVSATGTGAILRGRSAEALSLAIDPANMEPKYVHAFVTGLLAEHYGFRVTPAAETQEGAATLVIAQN